MLYGQSEVTLFEVSWEVCNKVGGIYSVVSSKVLEAVEEFGDNLILLGPDLKTNAEFEETEEECWIPLKVAMAVKNIKCRYGRWAIPGRPKVILVSFVGKYDQNQLLADLWSRYGVDSLSGGWDYIEPVLFSTVCADVIAAAYQAYVQPQKGRALAHFHEWMCGAGILHLKKISPEIGTVFTTHATMLGRSMAGADVNIYRQMRQISPMQEAAAYNITAKCSMETIAAKEADCFTTVSEITANEAALFLGRRPDVLTLNGLDLRVIPDYSVDRASTEERRRKVLEAAGRLLRKDLPVHTRIFVISGRYEFHNKGIDVFLEGLAKAEQAMQQTDSPVLAICAVMGGHMGVNPDAVSGDPAKISDQGPGWISSHYVHDMPHDPIITTCNRLGLTNGEGKNINVIFVPCLLDGHDGFFNMTYYDLLSACDCGFFPSWYEPWGYTPQESAAHAVPTVTTDLSGFGQWAKAVEKRNGGKSGVSVIARNQSTYENVVMDLNKLIIEYASCPKELLDARRAAVRHLAGKCTWEQFFPYYRKAYTFALDKTHERGVRIAGDRRKDSLSKILQNTSSTTPNLHLLTAVASLPPALSRLRELAQNLWWSWHPEAWKLFQPINPREWDSSNHNPVQLIEEASPEAFRRLAEDKEYLALYHAILAEFDAYMEEEPPAAEGTPDAGHPIAYFSTEYGLHESLPIYSGGLGVLSGDHLKAASDLHIPLVAIGLLYRNGYFRQKINSDGRQIPIYPENNFDYLPVEKVQDMEGNPLLIDLDIPGRKLYAQVWVVLVGRIKLFLLDTDVPQNTVEDRKITARLYEADREIRLCQEILLGMGGVKMLRRLTIWTSGYHMNEGHSVFMALERIQRYMMEDGLSLAEAKEMVRSNTIFTTHTPVEAGNERFSTDLMVKYFTNFAHSIGVSVQDFLQWGQAEGDNRHVFEMTILALRMAFKANGVSKLHGLVSQYMWRHLWKGVPVAEVPIGYVTNGIHTASYVGPHMHSLLKDYVGENYLQLPSGDPAWEQVDAIPTEKLRNAKRKQKAVLFDALRASLPAFFQKYNIPIDQQVPYLQSVAPDKLDTLTICFARRFAPYKRAAMLFANLERLMRIIAHPQRPVIVVFAGKAHPADEEGIKLIQKVIEYCRKPEMKGKIFFMEDYSLKISRLMVQGCDVWLNNPRRPYEASGTSGQKVPVNGGLNLSISDGWWCEGQGEKNGWTIGPMVTDGKLGTDTSDYADAESLYALLENSVVPLYYTKDAMGYPSEWMEYSKRSIKSLTAQFSTARMVTDYMQDYYKPAAAFYASMKANKRQLMRDIVAWKHTIPHRFATMGIGQAEVSAINDDVLVCGQPLTVRVPITLGEMQQNEVRVQLVIGTTDGTDFTSCPHVETLKAISCVDGVCTYEGSYSPDKNGRYAYGLRVFPVKEGLPSPWLSDLVLWA